MEVSTTSSPSRTVWTGTLLHKCHPLATLNAKTATGLACAPPDTLHVQQKIQFEKFAAQLLPSKIQNKSTQLSCHMQHFDDGGRGFQPCVLSCEDDSSRKWSRFADFLHKDNSVGVATAEGRTLEDSKVCLFLIPALLLYPYLDARSSESSERLFGLFSWHLAEDSAKETKKLNLINETRRHDHGKANDLENCPSPSQQSDTLTKPQSPKAHGPTVDTHTTSCPKLTEPISKESPSANTNICKPIAATLLQEVHIEEVSNLNQTRVEDVSVVKDADSCTTTGSYGQISKSTNRHESYGLSYLTSSFQKSSGVKLSQKQNNRFAKARKRGSGSGKGGAQLKNDLVHVPQKGQMSGRNIATKLPTTYKLSPAMMNRLMRTRHLQPMLKLKRIKQPPDTSKLASKLARNPTATVSKQSEVRNKPNLEKSGSSFDKRHLHMRRQPLASKTSVIVPSPLPVPQLEALKPKGFKSPEVADFHDPFDCDMMPQTSPELSHGAVSHVPKTTMMDKHVPYTFDINKHVKTASTGPIKSAHNPPQPAGPTRIPLTGRHVNALAKDPRQVPLRQGPAVKMDMILPEDDQSDYLENLINQDLQRMSYHNILPSQDRCNKRKISYEDYVSKHPKIYPKVDSSQQTELHITRNMGTMARLRKPHKHASVQVNAPPKTKDPVYEFQQLAMKQSIISALSALITRLRTGMTINTQITAILTLEKIIDIITKTARFDLEDKLKEESADSSVFLDGGDRLLTPSLPTYPLPGIFNLTTGTQANSEGLDTLHKVSMSENSTSSMAAPPRCKTSETESAVEMCISAPSDHKSSSQKGASAAEIDMVQEIIKDSPDSPVPSPSEQMSEKTSDGRSSQITGGKERLASAPHTSEKMTPNYCKTYPQKIESETQMIHEIKDSPDSPVPSPSEKRAEKTSDGSSYQISERKVTVGSALSPYQLTTNKMTVVNSSPKTEEEIAKLQTANVHAIVDSIPKTEVYATPVKEDKVITSAVDQKTQNAKTLHYEGQTVGTDVAIHHHTDDYMFRKQPSNIDGQPVVGVHTQEFRPLYQCKLNNDETKIIPSDMGGQSVLVLPKQDIDDRTSYRSALYKDSCPKEVNNSRDTRLETSQNAGRDTKPAYSLSPPENVLGMEQGSSRDKSPESRLRETRDKNYNMVQVRNIPTMEDQDYRGRSLDTRFSKMGGPFIPVTQNHYYSNVHGQQDTGLHQGRIMEMDSKKMAHTMAGNSNSVDCNSYVPAVYTNVHAPEEKRSREIRLDLDPQGDKRDTHVPVSMFRRNVPVYEEDTSRDRSLNTNQKEVRNAQNLYTSSHGNSKPVDCSYVPAVYTNVHASEEENSRGRTIDPSQLETTDTRPSYSMVQRGNVLAIGEQASRSRNLNQDETRNRESADMFPMKFPAKEEENPRHRNPDLNHQEMRDTQNFESMVHDGRERVIELIHHNKLSYWAKYSDVQDTEPQHPEVNVDTTNVFGGVHPQSANSYYANSMSNQYKSQETKEKEEKQSSFPQQNLENRFPCKPTMTVNGKPKRRVEIIYATNNQQTVKDMGSQLSQEGSVTNTELRCDMEGTKTGETSSHNLQDLRNIIIEAQRLSAQKRDHKEDLFDTSEERTVQDATSQDLTGIKVTLRKKMPTDVKDTIAVINKCLHGSEDEERRFVMLGGQLPIRDTQAEKVHSLEMFTETTSSTDSTKQIQQNYVPREPLKTETTTNTVLQAGCDPISSDEENFSCAESYWDEKRNPSRSTACIEQEIHKLQDNYKGNAHLIDATLQKYQEDAEHRNSCQDENRMKSQPTNSKKPVVEYLKPRRVPHSTPPKAYQRMSSHSRTTKKKSDPPSRTHREGTDTERYRGKTILEMRLNRFFTFVTSWKEGTCKSLRSLQDEAILWHKRMNGTCQTFGRAYAGKCRAAASSLQWDGQIITMIEARLRLSQLNLASAMATYVTMSSVYEEIMKNYSKDGGSQNKSSKVQLDELLSNTEKTLDAIRDAQEKYGSVKGIPGAWLTTISEMSSACVRKSETLKGLINEITNEERERYGGSRQYTPTGPDYIDELQTQSATLTDLLLNLAKLQELPPEELQQLEQYGLPEHVLKECLQTIQGLEGSGMNSLDKEGASATDQSEFHRQQSFHRANAPESDVHNPAQFHRDRDEEEKSYKSIGYWHSKLNTVPGDKGRKRAHEITRYDRENDVNKTRIRHIHKTATGEIWTYHDKYEDSPGGYAQYRQHVEDRHSMDRSSHNSSLEISISSDEEHHYRRDSYDQRESWKDAWDWKGKQRKIVHGANHDIPPWKRNKNGGRGKAVGVKNQNHRPMKFRQYTGNSSKRFAKGKGKNLMPKPKSEFQENDNCISTANENPDNCSFKTKEAPTEVLQKNDETPQDIRGPDIAQFADQMHTADIVIERTHKESATVLKPLATSIPEQMSNIDVSEIKLPEGSDEKMASISMTEPAKTLSLKRNPRVLTSNSSVQNHRPKISFTIGSGKQKVGGQITVPRKSITEHSDTTEVVSADSTSKLKDVNQTSDSKPIKVPGHLTTKFGKLVSLNVVSNKPSNALKDIGVKYGCGENSDEAESSDVSDSSAESGSDSSDSESSDNGESISLTSHVISDDASSSRSTPNKLLARSDQKTPLPVAGRKFLQILGDQSQRRVASAIEVPPALRVYIDKTNYRVSMCPFGTNCRKGDFCWAAHDRSEIRKHLFKRLHIHELPDRTMWIDVDDVWRLNEFNPKLPVTGQANSLETLK